MSTKILTGNYAVAEAVRQSRVAVIAAYPITPQTQIVEVLASMVESGALKARYIRVEGERSAIAVCIGASSTGARTYTATSSQGLALMHELLYWAAASRLPIVMTNVNRALAPPWNIWVEHTDSMLERDTGWLQFYASTNQEAYDLIFQCFKLAETPEIALPVMLCMDGFILSHTSSPVKLVDQKLIDDFLPEFHPDPAKQILLDVDRPLTYGNVISPITHGDVYYRNRYLMNEAVVKAEDKFLKLQEEFSNLVGRAYGGLTYAYSCDDADIIIVSMGTLFNQTIKVVNALRKKGYKIGALKIRALRPFPSKDIKNICGSCKAIIVIDRDLSPGIGGILCWEIKSSLFDFKEKLEVISSIAGLGGQDVLDEDILELVDYTYQIIANKKIKKKIYWVGKRGV